MAQGLPLPLEPGREYVGLVCKACDRLFAIAGPVTAAPDQPISVGARKPLDVECPFCRQQATYTVDKLRRLRAPLAAVPQK